MERETALSSVIVALFEDERDADAALSMLHLKEIDQEAIKVVNHPDTEDSAANKSEKLENVLTNLGISTDAAHHCAQSVFAGATLVIVKASAQAAAGVRAILQQAGTLNYEPP